MKANDVLPPISPPHLPILDSPNPFHHRIWTHNTTHPRQCLDEPPYSCTLVEGERERVPGYIEAAQHDPPPPLRDPLHLPASAASASPLFRRARSSLPRLSVCMRAVGPCSSWAKRRGTRIVPSDVVPHHAPPSPPCASARDPHDPSPSPVPTTLS